MTRHVTATEARKNLFELIATAGKPGAFVMISHEGTPKVVMMSLEEFEGWQETLEIMSDPELAKDIRKDLKQIRSGKKMKDTVDFETVKKQLKL